MRLTDDRRRHDSQPTREIECGESYQDEEQQHGNGFFQLDETVEISLNRDLGRPLANQGESGHDHEHRHSTHHVEQHQAGCFRFCQPVVDVFKAPDVFKDTAYDDERHDLILLGNFSGV